MRRFPTLPYGKHSRLCAIAGQEKSCGSGARVPTSSVRNAEGVKHALPMKFSKRLAFLLAAVPIINLADRKRVARYYQHSTVTDQQTIASIKATAGLYDVYLIVKSRRGVHSLPGGKIRIESRAENDLNWRTSRHVDRTVKAGKYKERRSEYAATPDQRGEALGERSVGLDSYDLDKAIRKAAFLYNRLWNAAALGYVRNDILEKRFDVEQEIVAR